MEHPWIPVSPDILGPSQQILRDRRVLIELTLYCHQISWDPKFKSRPHYFSMFCFIGVWLTLRASDACVRWRYGSCRLPAPPADCLPSSFSQACHQAAVREVECRKPPWNPSFIDSQRCLIILLSQEHLDQQEQPGLSNTHTLSKVYWERKATEEQKVPNSGSLCHTLVPWDSIILHQTWS